MSAAPLLLLFDIDGTLLLGATEAHREVVHDALADVYGLDPRDARATVLDPGGRTDGEIARLILTRHGFSAQRVDAGAAALRRACCRAYARRCPDDLSHAVAPGVAELLAELAPRADVRLALLTGNFEEVARVKLGRAGLGGRFAPGQGAFGSDAEERAALPAIARGRAGSDGTAHPRERTVVIGDTPRDIACAHADGVRCLAVATGRHPPAALRAADAVARDARELAPLIRSLAG